MEQKRLPRTLIEAIRYFQDPDVCVEFIASLRWPDGFVCPICESTEYSYLTTRRLWKCKNCKKQTSVKKGTIFEDSGLSLDKWLASIWLIANSKNGVSSHELARSVGITQKSAWFVLHRIRLAMRTGSFMQLDGEVETDTTFIGGKARNMHESQRKQRITGTGFTDKTAISGVVQRGGEVRGRVVPDTQAHTLEDHVFDEVLQGTKVYTNGARTYALSAMPSTTTPSTTRPVSTSETVSTRTRSRTSGHCSNEP